VSEPTLEMLELLLVHVPPSVVELRVAVDPAHTVDAPVIGAGPVVTVTPFVATQPDEPVV
jgi:hypothetical protein